MIKETPIIFIDEGTSSLDNKTAKAVSDIILQKADVTCLSIMHQLQEETLKKYDSILVFRHGKIVESGKFEELLDNNTYFSQLYTSGA